MHTNKVPNIIDSSAIPSASDPSSTLTKAETYPSLPQSTIIPPSSSSSSSSSSVVSNVIVPMEARITMDPNVHRRAAHGRERLYVAEAITVQGTIDGGRERVRSSLSGATRLLLIGPLSHSVAESPLQRQANVNILPYTRSSDIIDHPWVSWSTVSRTQRWKYAGNPSLGI